MSETKTRGLFPYPARMHQPEMMALISRVANEGGHLIMESGTGTGKTVCTLAPLIETALAGGKGKRIIYTTRTNSQQQQVVREVRAIADHNRKSGGIPIGADGDAWPTVVCIQGRAKCCPMLRMRPEWTGGTLHELSLLCRDLKKAVREGTGPGCPFFGKLVSMDIGPIARRAATELPTMEELSKWCEDYGVCPYELAKALAARARVIIVPYIYVFHPDIRPRLLEWANASLEEVVLVVDEAHNLADYVRSLRTFELSVVSLERAIQEAIEFRDPHIAEDVTASRLCGILMDIMRELEKEYLIDEDGLVPPDIFEAELLSKLRVSSPRLVTMVREMALQGEMVQEARRREGKLPRSYMHAVGFFLMMWQGLEGEHYVRLIARDTNGGGPSGPSTRLEAYCLDPSVAGEVFKVCHGTIHLSGTLSPLEEYKDSIGLPDGTVLASFPSPFPPGNRLVAYDPWLTTQYELLAREPEMFSRIADTLVGVCGTMDRNTAVFFPSFEVMGEVLGKGAAKDINRTTLVERRGDQVGLMETVRRFKEMGRERTGPGGKPGGVLFSVIGGRVSEGMDFPDAELEVAIIVGIPYPKPTTKVKALRFYYDQKYGKGWEYVIQAPTTRKLLQTIGRLIRNENDRGIALILDRRAVHFAEFLPGLIRSEDHRSLVRSFFEKGA